MSAPASGDGAARPPAAPPRWRRLAVRILAILPLVAIGLALLVLQRLTDREQLGEILSVVQATPAAAITTALLLMVAAYGVLTAYDWLALRYVGSSVPYRRAAPISLVAYGIGNSVGFPLFTSAPLRFRLYAAAGLAGGEVIRLIGFVLATYWVGLLLLGGGALLWHGNSLQQFAEIPALAGQFVGASMLAAAAAYALMARFRRAPVHLRHYQFSMPGARLVVGQFAVSTLDWLLTASVLWVLLPRSGPLPFGAFVGAFVVAQVLGVASHVPGGLGVFEASLLALLSPWIAVTDAAAALILFRIVYYAVPLVIAVALVVILERRTIRQAVSSFEERAAPWLGPIVPRAVAIATFAAGAFLLVTGSFPSASGRLRVLNSVLPIELINTSHLVASVTGLSLLVLARGLARRLDGAWHAAVWISGLGLISALLRGLDIEEALVVGVAFVLLLLSHRHFYRRASLLSRPFSPRWILAVAVVLAGGLWLGFLVNRDAGAAGEQFWRLSLRGDLPRFLRAQIAIACGLLVLGLWRLLRGAPPPPSSELASELEQVHPLVSRSRSTVANFAFLGDKRFLFAPERRGFLMYGVSGDSWISMGDPIVPDEDPEILSDLIWRFREEADLYDERAVFYQVRPQHLPLYLEAGLSVIKLGESGRISLPDFSLQGGAKRDLRQSLNKAQRDNVTFEMVPPSEAESLFPELRSISDEWLADKNASEKSFSLGCFDEAYLRHFPFALVRREGRLMAFANVLAAAEKHELTVDLMRHRNEAPPGIMDFLFAQLMLWGQAQGFKTFSMGMAPLAGLERHALAPTWDRLGSWFFRHGEHFYNFKGLRAYKEKFSPQWEPRYLAAPDGLATSQALFDVARLISGGLRGLVLR